MGWVLEAPDAVTAWNRVIEIIDYCHADHADYQRYCELVGLKTMPYKAYLKTDHWRSVRDEAMERCGFKCQLCSSEGKLRVHHNTYERLGEEFAIDVIVLCSKCHAKRHDKGG